MKTKEAMFEYPEDILISLKAGNRISPNVATAMENLARYIIRRPSHRNG